MQGNTLIQAFAYGQKPVRTTIIEGEPWFAAKDVCEVLGYVNDSDAIKKHCKEHGVAKRDLIDSLGRTQEAAFINEPNLYRLVVRSRKAEAAQFESWVMEDVLPQIRKTGTYRAPLGISDDPILATLGAIVEMRTNQLVMEQKVNDHESRLAQIENHRLQAEEAMQALPEPTVEVRDLTMREQCREAVNKLVSATGISHADTWKMVYARFDLVHNCCLTKRAGTKPKLDYLESVGRLHELYGIICLMIERAKKAA